MTGRAEWLDTPRGMTRPRPRPRDRRPPVRVAEALPNAGDAGDVAFDHVTDRSGDVRDGSLFVARRGGSANGEDFAADAVRHGAVAIV